MALEIRFFQKNLTYTTDHKEMGEWVEREHTIQGQKILQYRLEDWHDWKDVPLVVEEERA